MNSEIKLYELYFNSIEDPTFLDLLTYYAYKLNNTKILKNKLHNIIHKLESIKFGHNNEEKLIESTPIDIEVQSVNGYNHAINFYRTKEYEVYHLELDNGYNLDCADEHLVYSSINCNEEWTHVDLLTDNHYILTDDGWIKVKSIVNTNRKEYMADISVIEDDHSYFSNGILSHNTTTTAAYITWYICFHEDRNVFICANKGRTATEIMGKVKEVIEGLPYFLKPGIINLSESRMKFENGCTIKCAAASKSPATGDSIQLLYIDEAALIPGNVIEEYWASVIPTMSSFPNSLIIISSTPRGKQNRFFKIVDGAIKKENDFFFQRVDWWEVPGRDEKWALKQRDLLGDELFEREFNLSFDTNAARLISDTTIKEMEKNKKEFVTCEFYNIPVEISKNIIWHPDFRPDELTYYDLKNRRFLLVIDTAQGIEAGAVGKKDSDYNIINIFEIVPLDPEQIEKNRNNNPITIKDCVQYKQVGIYMDNFKDESVCAEAAKFISFHILKTGFQDIDNTRILVEMNFNGNNWLNKFKQHPSYYEAVMLKTPHGINQAQNGPVKLMVGFKTTSGARGKNYYCELGAKMMHQNQIIISQNNDNDINKSSIGQLTAFEKVEGKYMGICCHDDISVTCLFVPIAFDAPSYILWLQEWLEGDALNLYNETVLIILHMLEIYIDKEVEMDDETYNAFYNAVGKSFGKLTHPQKGYSSLLNQENSSSYNVGFGNMISSRR